MNKILIKIQKFSILQTIYVLDEKNVVIHESVTELNNLSSMAIEICQKFKINEVTFIGSKIFNSKYGKEIQELGFTKYNNNIKINYQK